MNEVQLAIYLFCSYYYYNHILSKRPINEKHMSAMNKILRIDEELYDFENLYKLYPLYYKGLWREYKDEFMIIYNDNINYCEMILKNNIK